MGYEVSDLLAEKPVLSPISGLFEHYKGLKILVTGAVGSIGFELVKALSPLTEVTGIDTNEDGVARLGSEWNGLYVANFRDLTTEELSKYPYVFHCAAFKHVTLGASNAIAYHMNNNHAVRWLALHAKEAGCKIVLTSTDKAAGSSVMGVSKRRAEEAMEDHGHVAVRLGNVAYSRGSVLERWCSTGKVRCVPDEVVRYWMTRTDAVTALLTAGLQSSGTFMVSGIPKFTMGEIREAFMSKGAFREYTPVPLGPEESACEAFIRPDEEVCGVEGVSYLARIFK